MFDVEGTVSGDTRTWLLTVPEELWARRQLIAALAQLGNPDNWQLQGGDASDKSDIAAFFQDMLDDVLET